VTARSVALAVSRELAAAFPVVRHAASRNEEKQQTKEKSGEDEIGTRER